MNVKRPDIVKEEHLEYLDTLRATDICNMFGARPFLQTEFSLVEKDAQEILKYWIYIWNDAECKW